MEKELLLEAFNAGIYKSTGDTDVTYINDRPTFNEWYEKVVLPQADVSGSVFLRGLLKRILKGQHEVIDGGALRDEVISKSHIIQVFKDLAIYEKDLWW